MEHEPSYTDYQSSSTLLLRCSLDSKGSHTSFEWTDYCMPVFRKLQVFDEIDGDDYIDSVRGHETLRFLLTHKKNVSPVRLAIDDRFILKIIGKYQMKAFLDMLPKYYQHMKKYRNSLLTSFYGLHVVKPQGGPKVRFIVAKNFLRTNLSMHKQFVIRGSSNVHKSGDVEDLNMAFQLSAPLRSILVRQLKHDCSFLEDIGLTNYSLLLGMHISSAPFETVLHARHASSQSINDIFKSSDANELENGDADQDAASDKDSVSSCPLVIEGKLGVKMGARAVRRNKECNFMPSQTTGRDPQNNVILYFGIIEMVPSSSMLKHVEHIFRSLNSDSPSVSSFNPKTYSARFQENVCSIFPENDYDGNML
ncbi:hypothetical protein Cni_G21191 [Canna indica]|uniref:1-phosphatidylinositol-4-phosphate 5-kinase n=1 Tax=Canna indica TaxID=4628 RepID=A0AAQ3KQB2_9LILI|nr:hypothetical protein Cni_G21191 [Canna indica]